MTDFTGIAKLGQRMNAQDNRGTQLPFFVVQEKVKRYDNNGDRLDFMDDDWNIVDRENICEQCLEDGYLAAKDCDDCKIGSKQPMLYSWEWKDRLGHGIFLTGEACDAYIASRRYEFAREVRSYAYSAYWSREFGQVLEWISAAGTEEGKPVSQYRV